MRRNSPLWTKPNSRNNHFRSLLVYWTILALLFANGITLRAQRTSDLKGESAKVNVLPNTTVDAKEIKLKADRDHDGMPDEDEEANGTNPDDASDADSDNDSDGITNGDEFSMGTNLNSADTDGDGFSDAEEILQGFNPLDANSHPAPPAAPGTYQVTRSEGAVIVPGDTDIGNQYDEGTTDIPLPFDYTLYDQTFSSASISSNGVLQFSGPIGDSGNVCLPYPYFNYAVLPLWDNLRTDTAGVFTSISGVAPNRIFNIEWRAELVAGGETHFEVRLYEGQTRFDVIYGNVTGAGNGATIGVQRQTGLDFTQYSCDGTTAVGSGTQLSFALVPGSFPTPTPLQITPNPVNITINSLLGQRPVQLRVTRANSGGSVDDLTTAPGTTYSSSNTNAAIVDDFGVVAGVAPGPSSITVQNGDSTGAVPVAVSSFNPSPVSSISIPGYANSVSLAGNYAYVATGAAGLQVINVSNQNAPVIGGALDTPGNANDVKVVGNTAFVADGPAGLQIIDVTNPASPVPLGTIDTPGDAQGVAIAGNLAYVADGDSFGLQIIDISTLSTPAIVGSLPQEGTARSVAVSGNIALLARDFNGLSVVDVSNPANPQVVGSVLMRALRLRIQDKFAYVATGNSIDIVDFSIPANPRTINSAFGSFATDVEFSNAYAITTNFNFVNNPLSGFDANDPTNLLYQGVINSPTPGISFFGTAISLDPQYAYWTAVDGEDYAYYGGGQTATSRFFIVRYQAPLTSPTDTGGMAPTVSIETPQNGQSFQEGNQMTIGAAAVDDVQVAAVKFSVNGTVVIRDTAAPYQFTYTIPLNATSLVIVATAVDLAGNERASAPVTVNVSLEPPPTVTITTPAEGQILTEGQDLFPFADAADDGSVTQVVFVINGETFYNGGYFLVPTGITSLTFEAIATDNFGKSTSAMRTVAVVPDPPPTITIVAPAAGTQLTEGQVVEFSADASDNTFVNSVEFAINGQVFSDSQAPYRQSYTIPAGMTSLFLEATAIDNLGQRTTASRTFTVVPDSLTTVTGRVLDTSAQPVSGATAKVGQLTAQTGADGRFTINSVPTVQGDILGRVTATLGGQAAANASLPTTPVVGGTTDVGVVTLSTAPTAPTAFALADYNGDFVPDVFIGYPDRQSSIYSFSGGQFTPNTSLLLPFGAMRSGASLQYGYYGTRQQIFAQLAGRPGSVADVTIDSGTMAAPRTVDTTLAVESEYTAAGIDASYPVNNRPVVAFLKNGSGGTSLTVRFGNDSAAGYSDPVSLPVDSAAPLRSLQVVDVNRDGLQDLMVVKPVTGTDAKIVVYLRTTPSTFGDPIESSVTVRTAFPAKGASDFAVDDLVEGPYYADIAVIGDDRVRIYQGNGTGAFVYSQQVILPAGRIVTGMTLYDVSRDRRPDLVVTASDVNSPASKFVLIYNQTGSGSFLSPTIRSFTAPLSSGDTRIAFGEWGGNFQSADMIVIDGETIKIFFDVGPTQTSS